MATSPPAGVIIQNTASGANMNLTGGSLTIGNSSSFGAVQMATAPARAADS